MNTRFFAAGLCTIAVSGTALSIPTVFAEGEMYGCVRTDKRTEEPKSRASLRYANGPGECRKNETEVSWSVTGPAGPPGPAGADGQATTILRFEEFLDNSNGDIFYSTSFIARGCYTELYEAQEGDVAVVNMALAFTDHGIPGDPTTYTNASFVVGVDTSGNPFPFHPGYSGCSSVHTQVGWNRKSDTLAATRVVELIDGWTYRFAPSIQFDPSDSYASLYCSGSVVIYHDAQPVVHTESTTCP